jgi:hypothetical protein
MDKIDKFIKKYLDKAKEQEVSLQENDLICPSEETIACYRDNLLDANERSEVEEHLLKCENCLQHTILLNGLKRDDAGESGSVKEIGNGTNSRAYPRVSTLLPVEFKFHPGHNGVISAKSNILNLSEGGMMMGEVKACHGKSGIEIPDPSIAGEELYDLRFQLNGSSRNSNEVVECSGECVREDKSAKNKSAGIRFKEIKDDHAEQIRDYITKEQFSIDE